METRCPVCGENLENNRAAMEIIHGGKQYLFCSLECSRLFQQFPEVYEGVESAEIEAVEDSGF
jgi:YHS domain-containing protein